MLVQFFCLGVYKFIVCACVCLCLRACEYEGVCVCVHANVSVEVFGLVYFNALSDTS